MSQLELRRARGRAADERNAPAAQAQQVFGRLAAAALVVAADRMPGRPSRTGPQITKCVSASASSQLAPRSQVIAVSEQDQAVRALGCLVLRVPVVGQLLERDQMS